MQRASKRKLSEVSAEKLDVETFPSKRPKKKKTSFSFYRRREPVEIEVPIGTEAFIHNIHSLNPDGLRQLLAAICVLRTDDGVAPFQCLSAKGSVNNIRMRLILVFLIVKRQKVDELKRVPQFAEVKRTGDSIDWNADDVCVKDATVPWIDWMQKLQSETRVVLSNSSTRLKKVGANFEELSNWSHTLKTWMCCLRGDHFLMAKLHSVNGFPQVCVDRIASFLFPTATAHLGKSVSSTRHSSVSSCNSSAMSLSTSTVIDESTLRREFTLDTSRLTAAQRDDTLYALSVIFSKLKTLTIASNPRPKPVTVTLPRHRIGFYRYGLYTMYEPHKNEEDTTLDLSKFCFARVTSLTLSNLLFCQKLSENNLPKLKRLVLRNVEMREDFSRWNRGLSALKQLEELVVDGLQLKLKPGGSMWKEPPKKKPKNGYALEPTLFAAVVSELKMLQVLSIRGVNFRAAAWLSLWLPKCKQLTLGVLEKQKVALSCVPVLEELVLEKVPKEVVVFNMPKSRTPVTRSKPSKADLKYQAKASRVSRIHLVLRGDATDANVAHVRANERIY